MFESVKRWFTRSSLADELRGAIESRMERVERDYETLRSKQEKALAAIENRLLRLDDFSHEIDDKKLDFEKAVEITKKSVLDTVRVEVTSVTESLHSVSLTSINNVESAVARGVDKLASRLGEITKKLDEAESAASDQRNKAVAAILDEVVKAESLLRQTSGESVASIKAAQLAILESLREPEAALIAGLDAAHKAMRSSIAQHGAKVIDAIKNEESGAAATVKAETVKAVDALKAEVDIVVAQASKEKDGLVAGLKGSLIDIEAKVDQLKRRSKVGLGVGAGL